MTAEEQKLLAENADLRIELSKLRRKIDEYRKKLREIGEFAAAFKEQDNAQTR